MTQNTAGGSAPSIAEILEMQRRRMKNIESAGAKNADSLLQNTEKLAGRIDQKTKQTIQRAIRLQQEVIADFEKRIAQLETNMDAAFGGPAPQNRNDG
jgi:hypothetical protein